SAAPHPVRAARGRRRTPRPPHRPPPLPRGHLPARRRVAPGGARGTRQVPRRGPPATHRPAPPRLPPARPVGGIRLRRVVPGRLGLQGEVRTGRGRPPFATGEGGRPSRAHGP